jgi:enoyl-CoA hydratase/carnithine racemase
MVPETINAIRDLNNDPNTIFTVLTGEGRFFCAGADVRGNPPFSIPPKTSLITRNQAMVLTATRSTPMIQRRN